MRFSLLISFVLFLIICSCQNTVKENKFSEYKYCNEPDTSSNWYKKICKCIAQNNLVFPTQDAAYTIIYKNTSEHGEEFTSNVKTKTDIGFIEDFREIIKDTSNFIWGEPGTPYIDYKIEFYNSKGEIINTAKISYDNYIEITPTLWSIKHGGLAEKGLIKFKDLINKYSNKLY